MIGAAFGHAEGSTRLNAFDKAWLAAGIADINLMKISSIVPSNTRIIAVPRITPGAVIPTAYAAMSSEVPGEVIAAAVGWALPQNREKAGVIMEVHDKATRGEAEETVVQMLREVSGAWRADPRTEASSPQSIRSNASAAPASRSRSWPQTTWYDQERETRKAAPLHAWVAFTTLTSIPLTIASV